MNGHGASRRDLTVVALYSAIFFMVGTGTAYAYLDPGIGSMVVQFVIAATLAALLSVRRVIAKAKSLRSICTWRPVNTSSSDTPSVSEHLGKGQTPTNPVDTTTT
jgi:hypothetical protein